MSISTNKADLEDLRNIASDRNHLRTLREMISEAETILSRSGPKNPSTVRASELLAAAISLADDLLTRSVG